MERNLDFKELFVESINNFCFHPFVIGSEDIGMDVVEVLSRVSNDDPSVVCTGNGLMFRYFWSCSHYYSCYRYHLLNEWKNLKWTDTDMQHIRLKFEGVHVTKFSVWMKLSSQVARSIGPWLFLIICVEFFYLDILVRTKFLLCLCCGIFAWMVHCLSSHVKRSRCEVNKTMHIYRCNRQKRHAVKQYHKNQRKTTGEKLHYYWLW